MKRGGFTLIEMIVGLALFSIIASGIFAIVGRTIDLATGITENENREMAHYAFYEMCRDTFAALPGEAKLDLKVAKSGKNYQSFLAFVNSPKTLSWGVGNRAIDDPAAVLQTRSVRGGAMELVTYTMPNAALRNKVPPSPKNALVLLENVRSMQWRIFDEDTEKWVVSWSPEKRRPRQIELRMEIYGGDQFQYQFVIPARTSTQEFVQSLIGGDDTEEQP